jgi:hypothetical protein
MLPCMYLYLKTDFSFLANFLFLMQSILVIKIFLKQLQDGKCNFKGDQMSLRKISPKISPNLFFLQN